MRKVLILSLCTLLGFSIIACDNKKTNNSNVTPSSNTPADYAALKQMVGDAVAAEGSKHGIDQGTVNLQKIPALYEVESVDFYIYNSSSDQTPLKFIASECGRTVGTDAFRAQIINPTDQTNSDCFVRAVGDDDLRASELKEVETRQDDYDVSELSFAVDNANNVVIRARIQFETEGEAASSSIASVDELSYIFLQYPIFSLNGNSLVLGADNNLKVYTKSDMDVSTKGPKQSSGKNIILNANNMPVVNFATERDGDKILTLQQNLEINGMFIKLRIAGEFEGIARAELENKLDGAATPYFETHRQRISPRAALP